jgi:FHS family Na+ dependent glucose MFS transporter 1
MLMLGIAEGTLDVGGNSLLIWVHGSKVGPFMNGLHFFFGLGAFISPIIIAQVILVTGDIVWAYWMLAILMVPIAFWILRTPSPVPHKASEDNNSPTVKPLFVALITLFYFTFIGIEAGFGNWLYTYAFRLKLTNEITGAYLTSAFWGAFTAGRLLSIPLAIRFRPRTLLISDLVGCFLSIGVILFWSHSPQALWLGAIGIGLSQASLFPIMLAWAERRIALTGRINGFFFMGTGAGGMFFPWFIGQLIEPIGPQAVMYVILFEIIATSVIFGVLLFYAPQPVRALGISQVDKREYDQVVG